MNIRKKWLNSYTKIIFLFLMLYFFAMFPANILAATSNSNKTKILTEIETQDSNIGWQYKVFDGVLYRRLYNYTTNTALTLWSIVPDT